MLVSLFTDASLDQACEHGGWGSWVRSERGRAWEGGAILKPTPNIQAAETWAVFYGLEFALYADIARCRDEVLVQLDNQHVISSMPYLWPKGEGCRAQPRPAFKRSDSEIEALDLILAMQQKFQIKVAGRWIKGHSNSSEPRNYINNTCDRLARDGRWDAREKKPAKYLKGGKEIHLTGAAPKTNVVERIDWNSVGD